MGCCQGKAAGLSRADRATKWKNTGIVGLRDSHLKELPMDVMELASAVRTLDITHNKLVSLPPDIGNFINLQRLILTENLLERLPSTLGRLRSLKVLALDANHLTMLPDEVGLLVRLERLSVAGNNLHALPNSFGSLRNLVLLDVSRNRLQSLPASLGSCASLEELVANDNMLEELPSSLSSLSHLKTLVLNNQKLKQLPPFLLRDCKALQTLSIHGTLILSDHFQESIAQNRDYTQRSHHNLDEDWIDLFRLDLYGLDVRHKMEGFQAFEERRKKKHDKQLDANVMIDSKGFDEGVDLHLMSK